MRLVCRYLEIQTPIVSSREFPLSGRSTERLIALLKELGATSYISGPSGKAYIDEDLFRQNRIALSYKTFDYQPYPQLWGPFVGEVTVLDLIANMGPDARGFIKSLTPNLVAVNEEFTRLS